MLKKIRDWVVEILYPGYSAWVLHQEEVKRAEEEHNITRDTVIKWWRERLNFYDTFYKKEPLVLNLIKDEEDEVLDLDNCIIGNYDGIPRKLNNKTDD